MTVDDLDEAESVLQVAVTALQASVPGTTGRTGSAFRYACGDLLTTATGLIAGATLFGSVQACFDLAVGAGATLAGLLALRAAMVAAAPTGQAAIYVAGICYCMALASEVKVLASTTFASSDDALRALAVISHAFDAGLEWTADNHLPELYQALLGACAASTRDLSTRAISLPRLVGYAFARGTTSHVLAYRLYGDAGRCDELRQENKAIHPAFMPPVGTALSE